MIYFLIESGKFWQSHGRTGQKTKLNQMVSHGLSPLELRFKGLYFGSYQDLT